MRIWVGVTDNRWYQHLSSSANIDEVNFWHPGGKAPFSSLEEGAPFLFKLKAPFNHIAGGAFYVRTVSLPISLAWEFFGTKNGADTYEQFEYLIRSARGDKSADDLEIGCSILSQPFFLRRDEWLSVSNDFARNIVSGKSFDTVLPDGARIWEAVQARIALPDGSPLQVKEVEVAYGAPRLVRPRRGQGAFRALVATAYGRRCAITGENTLPVLEAAHIKPVAGEGLNNTFNGLLLRSDFHKLFDLGLVTVTPDRRVRVSSRIKEQWFNGKAYYRLDGQPLASVPAQIEDQPRADLLTWHNDHVFEQRSRSA